MYSTHADFTENFQWNENPVCKKFNVHTHTHTSNIKLAAEHFILNVT